MANKIDSNVTGLAFAEETSPKVLDANPVFYQLEPNSYDDFGGELSTVARNPINPSRQRKKGTITDLDASGGFNTDFTQNNLTRLLQGFLFADVREHGATNPLNAAATAVTAVDGTDKTYAIADGDDLFAAGNLVFASGFTNPANNGLKTVTAVDATETTVAEALVDEASPPTAAALRSVGFQFASGDATLTVVGGVVTFGTTTANLNDKGLSVGEWVFIGGATANSFANNAPGYARIKSIAAKAIVFDKVTWSNPVTDAGAGKTIRMHFGVFLRNEDDPDNIKFRTYNIERTLGKDANGTQAEYLEGACANELTLNIPQADKLNIDLSFVALDNTQRDGTAGPKSSAVGATLVKALGEDAFNTSSNVYRIRMAVVDAANANPTALFGYVTEATLTINNNVTPAKAVGVLGAFDTTAGTFEVGGDITAYFSTVAAVQAVRNNADVTLDVILAKRNAAVIFDIPLLGLGGGRVNVEQDNPITIPVEQMAAESPLGFTLGITWLPYVPTAGMPT